MEKSLIRYFEKTGIKPKALNEKPRLPDHLVYVFSAFSKLSSCRAGYDSPIPWTAVKDYALFYKLDLTELADFITALDGKYLEDVAKKTQQRLRSAAGRKGKRSK